MYRNTQRHITENNNIHRFILRLEFFLIVKNEFLIIIVSLDSTGIEKSMDFNTAISCWLRRGLSGVQAGTVSVPEGSTAARDLPWSAPCN
jgi:hypothetical protein